MKLFVVNKITGERFGPFQEDDIYMRAYDKVKRYSLRTGLELSLICEGPKDALKLEKANG